MTTKRTMESENGPAASAAVPPSKEFLAEGSEQIYRTNTCPTCRRCFKMRSHLQEHLHLHFPDPSLQCPICKHFFTSKSKLRVHMLREAGTKLHHCHLCAYSAVEKNAIHRHLTSVHINESNETLGAQRYQCPSCNLSFQLSRTLKAHIKTHNTQIHKTPQGCLQTGCLFQSPQSKELIRHMAEEHGCKAVECRHHSCNTVFQSKADMENHYPTHLAYHCSECDFSCSNKTVFLQHQRQGHPGKDKLCCDFCSFVTFNPVEFQQHMGHLHANEKIHHCSQCTYETSHKRGLKRHMLMHSGEKPHKCTVCEFRCRDESYLSKHMLTHSNDKNFMCAECGYVTKWKHYLSVHMRKHAGDLRYSCDQCSYRCHRMDQLKSHKLRHQPKTLMCEICAYACKRQYELRNHVLARHSGEKRQPIVHKCKYCSYTTYYRQALQNHENCKHTRLKEFRCALCFYSSFSSISLFIHKRKIHGYIPGDKAWLENYAAKEKERNSSAVVRDFYIKPLACEEKDGESTVKPSAEFEFPNSNKDPVDDLNPVSSVEFIHEGTTDNPIIDSIPEEYCTLVLTTLSAADLQITASEKEEKNSASTPTFKYSNESHKHRDCSLTMSSSDEDDGPTAQEVEREDLLKNTDNPVGHEACDTKLSQSENNNKTLSLVSLATHHASSSNIFPKTLKIHDMGQADAMVLEGQVQMDKLTVPDMCQCEECSSATCDSSDHHCETRIKKHQCHACGMLFNQRDKLDSHLKNKCPCLKQKGISNVSLAANNSEHISNEKSVKNDTQFQQSESIFCNDPLPPFDNVMDAAVLISGAEQQDVPKTLASTTGHTETLRTFQLQRKSLYLQKDGKYICKFCSFSSVRLLSIKRHLATCGNSLRKKVIQTVSRQNNEGDNGDQKGAPGDVSELLSKKSQLLSCPSCEFTCKQNRALDSHKRKGCFKGGESKCHICSFVAKSKPSLNRHLSYAHRGKKMTTGRAKRMYYMNCASTCRKKQEVKQKGVRHHKCCYCPFSTTRLHRLEEHKSLHTRIGRHRCDLCQKTFGAASKLRQHKRRIHLKQPTHFCQLCDFRSYAHDDVRRHNRRCHTGALEHFCSHCNAQFSSEVALKKHCKRAHLESFSCKLCDYKCCSTVILKAHTLRKHPVLKCKTCSECFETKESLNAHQKTHLAYQCEMCPFGSRTRQLLARHLLNQHENGSPVGKLLKCNTCPFTCRHQLVLEHHLRTHATKHQYKCTDCEYSTQNKQKMTWHIRIHTGEKPYHCEQCSYSCADPSRLKLHMRVHREEKKYLCPDCGYKCKWATQLKYHMTKHTGEKRFVCNECDYRTNRADALRSHRDTQHCKERPFICEKCGKAFKTSFILKTHQRQHSDGHPYTCGLCQKAFRWPAGLRHHFLSHTKQQPFSCRHCPYTAKQRFQVVKHLHRHHPGVSAEQGVVRDSEVGTLTLKEALLGTLEEK